MNSQEASHEFLDHTSELQLRVCASNLGELIAEAGRAVGLILGAGATQAEPPTSRAFAVDSSDRDALVVDWLNEIIFVAETTQWVPTSFTVTECSDTMIRACGEGVTLRVAPALVKAATHHGVRVSESEIGLQAQVILDI